MPGVKRFDQEEALEKAMEAFWNHGYEGTSIQILEKETGVARSSLYSTFGDKEALFLKALNRYESSCSGTVFGALHGGERARDALLAMLRAHAGNLTSAARPRGCLMTRVAAEKGSDPGVVGRTIRQRFSDLESGIYEAVRRGQQRGEIRAHEDPRALARFLVATLHGMAVASHLQDDASVLRDVLRVAMERISLPSDTGDESP